eukprot:c25230_g1_i1 orf=130-2187(+)
MEMAPRLYAQGFRFSIWAAAVQITSVWIWFAVQAASAADVFYGLESALSQAHLDPLAHNDSFLSLPPALKKRVAQAGSFDTESKIRSLLSLQIGVPVTVKLVGFYDVDRKELESALARYINVLILDDRVKVIGGDVHELPIKTKVVVEVGSTARRLAESIHNAIEKQMQAPYSLSHADLQPVDYTAVDEIIQTDLEKPLSSYVIYLLNPGSQVRPYAYSYSKGDPSPGFSKCLGSIWTGQDRYLWVDLAAGPVEYGPALSGEGLLPRGESHPFAVLHSGKKEQSALIAELASLVRSAARMLLVPALRIPAHFEPELEVHFLHILGSDQELERKGLDLDVIERAFLQDSRDGLLLSRQRLKFKRHSLQFSTCLPCVAAVSQSMRSFTSRYFFENYTLIINQYLDSKELHFALRHVRQDMAIKAGITHSSSARVVYVYILDLDYDGQLLLDRYHQAVAFKDMVIAVRARSLRSISDYVCNGRHVVSQIRELDRPIIGALLQTLWGVTPIHLTWSTQHNSTIVDYTWAMGQTPFGPFSDRVSLSFVQRDAAPRNIFFTALNASISSAIDILQTVKFQGGEMKLLGHTRHVEFIQRWNVFLFKIEKAVSAMSHFDFNTALYFIKSSDYDLFALHRIVYDVAAERQIMLVCFKDPPFPWKSILLPVMALAVLLYVWTRGEALFTSKKKRF